MTGCDNIPTKELEPDIKVLSSTYDVALSPDCGVSFVYIPYLVRDFDNDPETLVGEGLDDLQIISAQAPKALSWSYDKFPDYKVALACFTLKPTNSFNLSKESRSITGLVFSGTDKVLQLSINLYTIPDSMIPGNLLATQNIQQCYFDYYAGTNFTINTTFDLFGINGGDFTGIIINKVSFAKGNLVFDGNINIIKWSEETSNNYTATNADSINYAINEVVAIDLEIKVKSTDILKEVIADTIIIEYALSNNPSQVYQVYSNTIVFANKTA
jgi:hypothetical protein